jgi:hypothetical protein
MTKYIDGDIGGLLMLNQNQIIHQFKSFALSYYKAEKNEDPSADFYHGRFHGASMILLWTNTITEDELKQIDEEAKAKAGI